MNHSSQIGYCVQPNSVVPPVSCTDDCSCLGTHLIDYELYRGFYLGCYDDYAYNVTTEEYYFATKVLRYYTETCAPGWHHRANTAN